MSENKITDYYKNKPNNIKQEDLLRLNVLRNAVFDDKSAVKNKKTGFKHFGYSFALIASLFVITEIPNKDINDTNIAYNSNLEQSVAITNTESVSLASVNSNSIYEVTDAEFAVMLGINSSDEFQIIDVLF